MENSPEELLSYIEKERLILLDHMQELVCIFWLHGRFDYANPAWHKKLGYEEKELKDLSFPMILESRERDPWKKIEGQLQRQFDVPQVTLALKGKCGEPHYMTGSLNPIPTPRGADDQRVMAVFQEMSSLFGTQKEWERFFLFAIDLLCIIETNGRFKRVNPAFGETLGYEEKDLQDQVFTDFIHPHDWVRTKREYENILQGQSALMFESRFRCKDGSYKWLSWTAYPFLTEGIIYAVARDITKELETKEKFKKMAFTDDLTGLLNRRGFNLFAGQLSQVALREKKNFLVLAVDLDSLKQINDQHGHAEGDAAIKRCSRILKGRFRASDVVARLGGDEFAVALITDQDSSPQRIREDLKQLTQERHGETFPHDPLSFSIGFAYGHVGRRLSLHDLLQEADGRMYQEKSLKRRPAPIEGAQAPMRNSG